MVSVPGTTLINLRDYFSPLWADVIADSMKDVGAIIMDFLSQHLIRNKRFKKWPS